ncbi:RDD family protein [soil metagenome]
MAVISITTTQNIELEYELASVGDRIVARILDLLIMIGYMIVISLVFSFASDFNFFYFLAFLPILVYSLVSEIFFNGQTVGKRVMNIKVISLNGNQASFGQYLIRWLFRLVDMSIGGGVIATIAVALSQKHQRIGDMVAGTIVVNTRPRYAFQQTLYVPVPDTAYTVTYPEVINLRDSDMQLIKEVILNVRKSNNNMLAWQTAEKLKSVLTITNHYDDPIHFLQVILTDYNHLASQEK